jgi:hypothetical protein
VEMKKIEHEKYRYIRTRPDDDYQKSEIFDEKLFT